MVVELVLTFKDEYADDGLPGESTFTQTLTTPEGFEITGGQIFVENTETSDLQRFSFRIERDDSGRAQLVVMENPQ